MTTESIKIVRHLYYIPDQKMAGTIYEVTVDADKVESTKRPVTSFEDQAFAQLYPYSFIKDEEGKEVPVIAPFDGISRVTFSDNTECDILIQDCKSTIIRDTRKG